MRNALWIILAAALLLGIAHRLQTLQQHAIEAGPSIEAARSSDISEARQTEDAALFHALLNTGLIHRVPETPFLKIVSPDYGLIQKARRAQDPKAEVKNPAVTRREAQLLKALYHSAAGSVVRSQVGNWNQAHRLVAIRDNRPRSEGRRHNAWHAYHLGSPLKRLLKTGSFVPESFGFVNQGRLRPHFTDWCTAVTDHDRVAFVSTIDLATPYRLTIQLIGKPQGMSGTVRLKPAPCCHPKAARCDPKMAEAFAFELSLPPGRHELKIVAKTVINRETTVAGLNIRQTGTGGRFQWRSLPHRRFYAKKRFQVLTADGVSLCDLEGEPSKYTQENGLLPLMGSGRRNVVALSGMLAKSTLPKENPAIHLTIDSKIQTVVQQTLTEHLDKFWPQDPYAAHRRAGMAVLDADTGAVLAVGGHPLPPPGTHPWDLVSFARVYPLKNPMVVRAWQGMDRHNAPGSSFKPVVALAALAGADDQKPLQDLIRGYSKDQLRRVGLSPGCAVYQPGTGRCYSADTMPGGLTRKISNFKRLPLSNAFRQRNPGNCPDFVSVSPPVLGLREAIRDSINVWFARLAVLMDGHKAIRFDRATSKRRMGTPAIEFPEFQLVKTVRLMGFDEEPLDLAVNIPEPSGLFRWQPKSGRQEGDVLYAHPGMINLMDSQQRGLLWILAQNAIGQGMTASPLQMARVAATIAGGRVVHPYLFSAWGGKATAVPAAKPLALSKEQLAPLHRGMQAVPLIGTARVAFKDHPDRCRTYGKTGTANVGQSVSGRIQVQRKFHTAWFVGWREPAEGDAQRLAFACMVTHVHGRRNTGGGVCAPIIAEVLKQLPATPKTEP